MIIGAVFTKLDTRRKLWQLDNIFQFSRNKVFKHIVTKIHTHIQITLSMEYSNRNIFILIAAHKKTPKTEG